MHRLKYIINTLKHLKKHLVLPVPSPATPPPPTPQCRVVQLDSSRYKGVLQSVCSVFGEEEPSADLASLCPDDSVQRVTGII